MSLLRRRRGGAADPMPVVTRFVNAANRHDADGVAACLHGDFDSIQPIYPSRNFRGADQVRRNWQAIFDAEPGFRLTVLRTAQADNTVWLELHGAGQDAEVAGVFVMGVEGDRVKWARIYSALVEPAAPTADAPAPEPPPPPPEVAAPEVAEEPAGEAADMETTATGRRRARLWSRQDADMAVDDRPDTGAAEPVPALDTAAIEAVIADHEPDAEVDLGPEPGPAGPVAGEPVAGEPDAGEAVASEADSIPPVDVPVAAADEPLAEDVLAEEVPAGAAPARRRRWGRRKG